MKYFYFIFFSIFNFIAFGQPNFLDHSFNGTGLAVFSCSGINDGCSAMVIQPDKKIIMVGRDGSYSTAAVIRCNHDGTLDYSFGTNGFTLVPLHYFIGEFDDVALQSDGKIVATGCHMDSITHKFYFATVRFNSAGSIDSSFSNDGVDIIDFNIYADDAKSIAIQHDGKIIVSGHSGGGCGNGIFIAMARYNTDGTLDNSFGNAGKVLYQVNGSSLSYGLNIKDGFIYVSGEAMYNLSAAFLVVKFLSNGQVDNSFGTNGHVITPVGNSRSRSYSINFQSTGKIICSGIYGNYLYDSLLTYTLIRYNTNGSIDNTFGNNGIYMTTITGEYIEKTPFAIQPDDKIVIGSLSGIDLDFDFAIARLMPDGGYDSTFGNNGIIYTDFGEGFNRCYSVAIQADGKIVASGDAYTPPIIGMYNEHHFVIARYLSEFQLGTIDISFEKEIISVYPNPISDGTVLEYNLTKDQIISISLYDLSGKLIKPIISEVKRKSGSNKEQLNLSGISNGTYVLTIYSQSINSSVQIFKK